MHYSIASGSRAWRELLYVDFVLVCYVIAIVAPKLLPALLGLHLLVQTESARPTSRNKSLPSELFFQPARAFDTLKDTDTEW